MRKLTACFLVLALVLELSGSAAAGQIFAQGAADEQQEAVTGEQEKKGEETKESQEQAVTKKEETNSDDETNMEQKADSETEDADVKRITGFVPLGTDGHIDRVIELEKKVTRAELKLPNTLAVNLYDADAVFDLPVSWVCADYEAAEKDTYRFTPEWDTTSYMLDTALQKETIPAVEVRINEKNQTVDQASLKKTAVTKEVAGASIQQELNALEKDTGAVTFRVTSAGSGTITIPADKGITSLTLTSDTSLMICNTLYASGVPVNLEGYAEAGTIYGGGNKDSIQHDTKLNIGEHAVVQSIYGGGYNGDVVGNVDITVNGNVSFITGGGEAHADKNQPNAQASVTGTIAINVRQQASFRSLHGGGYAYLYQAESSRADVEGNISIYVNSENIRSSSEYIAGGGNLYKTASITGELHADVHGNISIQIGANAKAGTGSMYLCGGGEANLLYERTTETIALATADVYGNIQIDATANAYADSYNSDSFFTRLYGGGYAKSATANVYGDTSIHTSRQVEISNSGAFGGGYASFNGQANIYGSTTLEVSPLAGQSSDYLNFKGLIGGGNAAKNGIARVSGDTHILINSNAMSEENNGTPIIGGGFADAGDGDATVEGNTYITVHENVSLETGITGGGSATKYANSRADVNGSVSITLKDHVSIKNLTGGGLVVEAGDAQALVKKDVSIQIGDYFTCTGFFYAGGRAASENAKTVIHGTITTAIGKSGRITGLFLGAGGADGTGSDASVQNAVTTVIDDQFTFGNWFYAGGRASKENAQTRVQGDITTTFQEQISINGVYVGSGGAEWKGSDASVTGSVTTSAGLGFSCSSWFYSAGRTTAENTKAVIEGSVKTALGSNAEIAGLFFGGGRAGAVQSDASVKKNVTTEIGDDFVLKSWFYAGGLAGYNDTTAVIGGDIKTTLGKNANISGQYIGGGAVEAQNCDASVKGNITSIFHDNFTCTYFTGAGRVVSGTDGKATVGSETSEKKVTTAFLGAGSHKAVFTDAAYGGGRSYTAGSNTTVYGDVYFTMEGVNPSASIYGGGYASASAKASITKGTFLVLKNAHDELAVYIYGGGYANGDHADANVKTATTTIQNVKSNSKNFIFGGGYASGATAEAGVKEKTIVNVEQSQLNYILGSGWSNGGNVQTKEIVMNITDSTLVSVYGAGYYSAPAQTLDAVTSDITVLDSTIKGIYPSGNSNGNVKHAVLRLLGTTEVMDVAKATGASLQDGMEVHIGDGSVETAVICGSLYAESIQAVQISDKAKLTHHANGKKLFENTRDIRLAKGGELVLAAFDEEISGDFTGGGVLQMDAGRLLQVGGAIRGDTRLKINGAPALHEVYVTSAQTEGTIAYQGDSLVLQQQKTPAGYQWKLVNLYVIHTSVTSGHGSITPSGDIAVVQGEQQEFELNPDEGYTAGEVLLDDKAVESVDNKIILQNVNSNHTLRVSFVPLKAKDAETAIDDITPAENDKQQHEDDALHAKIIYEQLKEEEKEKVSQTHLEELNKNLSELENIEVRLEKEGNFNIVLTPQNLHDLTSTITLDEAKQLKSGEVKKLIIKLIVNTVKSKGEQITEEETAYKLHNQLDISIVKHIDDQAVEKVTSTDIPIRLTITIPSEIRKEGRTYHVLRKHDKTVEELPVLEQTEETLTIASDRFSVFAIAYDEEKACTVIFDSMGGSKVEAQQNIQKGSLLTQPKVPVKNGYTFIGWYLDEGLQTAWDFEQNMVEQDMVLYAKWQKQKNGGENSGPTEPDRKPNQQDPDTSHNTEGTKQPAEPSEKPVKNTASKPQRGEDTADTTSTTFLILMLGTAAGCMTVLRFRLRKSR